MGQVLFAPALAGCTSDDVTASAAQVLSGYTALTKDSNDDPISGTMTNRGAWTSSSSGSGRITVPAGYHNGSGYVDCSGAYNAGVTAADARANSSSTNYKAGYSAGKSDVSLSVSGSYVNASNGKSARVNYKGQFYRNEGNNVGLAGDYFHATFPEGYYGSEGQAWAPEIRVPVGTMNSNGWYDQDQYNAHYNQGVTDADNRANANSTNYKSGYNAGVTAADNRTNTSSANYKAGYNAGYSAGHSSISSVKVTLSSAANPNSTSQSFNCTSISKWRSLVLWSNFFPVVRYYEYGVTHAPSNTTINYSYNSSNGILTVTSSHSDIVFHYGTSSATCYCDAYYF